MANVQPQFMKFHETIKLKRFAENATLREKRDRVLTRLANGIAALRTEGEAVPSYRTFDQGSYELDTGVVPLHGDFDIDVGVAFDISKEKQTDPVALKKWVLVALADHTKKVDIRRPCVTVFYQADGEDIYHVDLAIYSDAAANADGKLYLARGKEDSESEQRFWEEAEPDVADRRRARLDDEPLRS